MESMNFLLKNKSTYRLATNIWVSGVNGKLEKRPIVFSSEGQTSQAGRATSSKKIAAKYTAKNEFEVDALLRDSGYGITFVKEGDPEGLLKKQTVKISQDSAEKAALKNLFSVINLPFDDSLPLDVLKAQYSLQVNALAGRSVSEPQAPTIQIPVDRVNVAADIEATKNTARQKFEEKYGYAVPDVVANDSGFLEAVLSIDDFDAEAYISSKTETGETVETSESNGDDMESLRTQYFEKHGSHVPNVKKNDISWIKSKLI